MNSLLTVDEPDGFPVGMVVKCTGHGSYPEYIGMYFRIVKEPENPSELDTGAPGSGAFDIGDWVTTDGYYGQNTNTLDGQYELYLALSWMRPATESELDELRTQGLI